MTSPNKDLNYYMNLRYRIELIPEEDGWVARIPDIVGCVAVGDSIEEALSLLEDAKEGWFISCLKHGDPVPEPKSASQAA